MILQKAVYLSEDGKYRCTETVEKDGSKKTIWEEKTIKEVWQYYGRRHDVYESWCKHRQYKPAVIVEKPDGTVIEKYYRHDVLHREDGPASYHERGKLKGIPMYRLKGKKVSAYEVLGPESKEAFAHALKYEDGKSFT